MLWSGVRYAPPSSLVFILTSNFNKWPSAAIEDKMTLTFRNEMNEHDEYMMKALAAYSRSIIAVEEKVVRLVDNKLPVIISKDLKDDEKVKLIEVLKAHKSALAWKISDIKGIDPKFCTHKILMEDL
ncbi:hypothetical protein Tco_0642476 [Tanacetum coccineum]